MYATGLKAKVCLSLSHNWSVGIYNKSDFIDINKIKHTLIDNTVRQVVG